MGVVECLNHHLVEPYNVLYEKEGKVRHCTTGLIHQYIRVNVITGLSTSWGGNAGSTVCFELDKSYADFFV